MKSIVKRLLLLTICFIPELSNAQLDSSKVGFIRLVNLATAGTGNLKFKINGSVLYEPGYKIGQMTGGMGFEEGNQIITAEKEGCQGGERKFKILAGTTTTLVAYSEPVRDEDGRIIAWQLRITALKQARPQKGYAVTLVSLCPDAQLEVKIIAQGRRDPITASVSSRRLKVVNLGNARGNVSIMYKRKKLTSFSTDDPGNYVIMIYDTAEGEKAAIQYYDPKFMVAG